MKRRRERKEERDIKVEDRRLRADADDISNRMRAEAYQ